MRLQVEVEAAAPPTAVWGVLTEWERQSEWMLDAKAVEVLTPQREGVGVTIRCPTNLLGVTVQDVMRVTAWEEDRQLSVTHLGAIITGDGTFSLTPAAVDGRDGTRIAWLEEVDPPFGRLGEWGASTLVLPVLRRIFTRSLRNLAALAEGEVGSPQR